MKKNWILKNINKNLNLIDRILHSRGFDNTQIQNFLSKTENELSPYLFSDMEKAKTRILEAIKNKEKILIWGDFDCDGITSSIILSKTFDKLNGDFACFIPHRINHGHGLNLGEIIKFITKDKVKLIITVDCGISDTKIVSALKSFKVDTIITDHHKGSEENPPAFAIINPNAKNSLEKNLKIKDINSLSKLSGAGVAYKLSLALLENINDAKLKDELISLATIGTIGDVAELIGENRIICSKGIKKINLNSLSQINKLVENNGIKGNITSETIAFTIVPRINASGRLSDSSEAFEFLYSYDGFIINRNIEKLNNLNSIRQSLSDNIYLECMNKLKKIDEKRGIFLNDKDWHIGIIGLAASKIAEKYNKPTFLSTIDEKGMGRCSIRGIEPYDIYKVLNQNANLFENYGGHKLAGGFSYNPEKVSFEEIEEKVNSSFEEYPKDQLLDKKINIDIELSAEEITENFVSNLNVLEPYGEGNEKPIFLLRDAEICNFKQIGQNSKHLKLMVKKNGFIFECVWWDKANFRGIEGENIDIIFTLNINEFNGESKIQLNIIDADYKEADKKEFKIFDYRNKENILEAVNNFIGKNKDIRVWAKKFSTLNAIREYKNILYSLSDNIDNSTKKLLFLDYPIQFEKFQSITNNKNLEVLYLTKEVFETDGSKYFTDIFKMLNFANRKKNGAISIAKMSETLGITEDFTKYLIDTLSDLEIINIENDKSVMILKENIPNDIIENECNKEQFLEYLNEIISYKTFINSAEKEELLNF